MSDFKNLSTGGGKAYSNYEKKGHVKTIQFDELTGDGNTVEAEVSTGPRGVYYVKVTGDATLEFQGSALGGGDDADWVNQDDENIIYDLSDESESFAFSERTNFARVKVTGVTGTVNITLVIGE